MNDGSRGEGRWGWEGINRKGLPGQRPSSRDGKSHESAHKVSLRSALNIDGSTWINS